MVIPNYPTDQDIADGYPDFEEVVARLRAVEQMISDKRGGGLEETIKEVEDDLLQLETAFENLEYNLKKNLDEIIDSLRWTIEMRNLPLMRWNRKVRI